MKSVKKAIEAAGELREALGKINFEEITGDKLEAAKLKYEMLESEKSIIDLRNRLFEIIGGK